MPCVTENDVVELLEGTLVAARRDEVLGELARCSSCRALVDAGLLSSAGAPVHGDGALPAELAGYVLGEVLGAGAGGVVVRARDSVLEREVALKVLRTRGDGDPYPFALHEARKLAMLRHPAIVSVYAAGAVERIAYVAMELVDGASLATRIAKGPLPWRRAVAQFADVADGLAAIHEAELVHRDVKPGNLLVDGDRIRIADFGLAVRGGDRELVGTLPYVAPEVLAGEHATARSDIYSLFASLFESITGARPYGELEPRALRAAAERGPEWPEHVPRRVRRVIERGLAAEPPLRFPTARDAAAALRRLAERSIARPMAVLGAVAVAAGAFAIASHRASCELGEPRWHAGLATLEVRAPVQFSRLAVQLAHFDRELAGAQRDACRDDAGPVLACLTRLDDRMATIVAQLVSGDASARSAAERAVFALPAPASCADARQVEAASLLDASLIASARSALDLGQPRRARDTAAAIGSGSPVAGDAELVRGEAALALDDFVAAATAFRETLERGANTGRRDLVMAANLGLALAIGIHQRETAAGEAYAAAARSLALELGDARMAARAHRVLGWLAYTGGDAARGDRELAAAIAELTAADAPLDISQALVIRAAIARDASAFERARGYVEAAFAIRREVLGPDHPDTLRLAEDRAKIDELDGHARRAIELMTTCVARLEALYGETGALAGPLTTLGTADMLAGDYAAAESPLGRALALYRADRGELDRNVADAYMNLAGLHLVQGKFGEAADLYRAAIASARSVLGDAHPDLAPLYYGLGVALASAHDYAGAAEADGHAIAIYRAHPGHDGALAKALAARGLIELGTHDLDPARADSEGALAILTRLHGDDHIALTPALSALAQIELEADHLDRARTAIERAIAIHVAHAAPPRQLVEERFVLARILWHQNHHPEALAAARDAVAGLGDHDPALANGIHAWLQDPERH